MSDRQTALTVHGKPISPGLAEGLTYVHRDMLHLPDMPVSIETKDVDEEVRDLEISTAAITEDLLALATRVEREMDANLAAVFDAHQQMLNDPVLKAELRAEIRGKLVSARSAVKSVFLRWERRFLEMESRVAQQKGADMRDISNRLSSALAGVLIHPLEQIPPGRVLVARRLLPSDTIFLSKCSAAAVLLEHGHTGSHAALFVRAMGLPCIANIRDILTSVPANVHALVNADLGEILLSPSEADEARFRNTTADRNRSFAADRENVAVEMYFNDSDAVIFRLLRIAHDDAPRMPLSICGELAGRAAHVAKLLLCGIRSLSVAPPLIPIIKEAVRSSSIE